MKPTAPGKQEKSIKRLLILLLAAGLVFCAVPASRGFLSVLPHALAEDAEDTPDQDPVSVFIGGEMGSAASVLAETIQSGISVLDAADQDAAQIAVIMSAGTRVSVMGVITSEDDDTWYEIWISSEMKGYVPASCLRLLAELPPDMNTDPSVPAPTPAPEPTAVPASVSDPGRFPFEAKSTIEYLNVRSEPDSGAKRETFLVDAGTVVTVLDEVRDKKGGLWYKVRTQDGTEGYVMAKYMKPVVVKTEPPPKPSDTPTPEPGKFPFEARSTIKKVNVRANPDAGSFRKAYLFNPGTVVTVLGETTDRKGVLWYKVRTDEDVTGYVMAEYLVPVDDPGTAPAFDRFPFQARSTIKKVNVRVRPDSTSRRETYLFRTGTVVTVLAETSDPNGALWYKVRTQDGIEGYAMGQYLEPVVGEASGGEPSGESAPMVINGEIYGVAVENLETRSAPSSSSTEMGTYPVKGQYIKIIARAFEENAGTWWVKCEIRNQNEIWHLWTWYSRFDSSTLPLDLIPMQ